MAPATNPMAEFNRRIEEASGKYGRRNAFADEERTQTFNATEAAVAVAVAWLKDYSPSPPRIAALTLNRIETVMFEWAVYRLGGIWIGVPARERDPANLQNILDDFSPHLLLVDTGAVDLWKDENLLHLEQYGEEIEPPSIFDPTRYRALRRTSPPPFEIDYTVGETHERITRIRYSSGSSGEPKAIAYTPRTALAILDNLDKMLGWVYPESDPCPDDLTMIQALPIVWATGSLIAPVFCRGGKNVLLPRWSLTDFVHLVAAEQNVLTFLTPGLLAQLAAYSEISGAGWAAAPGCFRLLVAGSPLPISTMRRVAAVLPEKVKFYVTLGQTEASFPITWNEVTKTDWEQDEHPFIPLGKLTEPYGESVIDTTTKELKLGGPAVAPGRWVRSTTGNGGKFLPLPQPNPTGDLVKKDEHEIFHYLGRWGVVPQPGEIPAPEAVEAVINDSPGVARSRLDYCREGRRSVLTVRPHGEGVSIEALRAFFDHRKGKANLPEFDLDDIRFGDVPLTMTGKVQRERKRREEICSEAASSESGNAGVSDADASPHNGTDPKPGARPNYDWQHFNFSQLETGPLYFYVGSGLSMGPAGLVGWGEMAWLIWLFQRHYEGALDLECPADDPEQLGAFIHAFVMEEDEEGFQILSRKSKNPKALGRAVLLNLMLRYRAPRFKLIRRQGQVEPISDMSRNRHRPGQEPSSEDLFFHSLIWRSRCHGVLTTNYDMLLENAHARYHGAALRSYRYNAHLLRYLLSNRQFVLKLHGDINDLATMQFDPDTAWEDESRFCNETGRQLQEIYNAVLLRGHMVYVGCGFGDETIRQLHGFRTRRGWRRTVARQKRRRVALMPDLGEARYQELKQDFDEIEFLTFPAGSFHEVGDFLQKIVATRTGVSEPWETCPEASQIHRQIFQPTSHRLRLEKKLSTEPWTCRGTPP